MWINSNFFLLYQSFQKSSAAEASKCVCKRERVNINEIEGLTLSHLQVIQFYPSAGDAVLSSCRRLIFGNIEYHLIITPLRQSNDYQGRSQSDLTQTPVGSMFMWQVYVHVTVLCWCDMYMFMQQFYVYVMYFIVLTGILQQVPYTVVHLGYAVKKHNINHCCIVV